MSISWDKLGLIFCPDGEYPWMQSHAANPVAEFRHDDVFRIYFGSRDTKNRSHIGYVDIDLNRPKEILSISDPANWELSMTAARRWDALCITKAGGTYTISAGIWG
jgi:hypothetical protein